MFEFYFQSGEFLSGDNSFITDLIVEVSGAFVGAFTAVYIFIKQNNISKQRELDSKKEFEIQKLMYLKTLITNAINFSENLVTNIQKFNDEIELKPMEIPLLKMTSNKEINILANKINREEYFHAYFNQFGSYEIEDIFHAFDVIFENSKLLLESLSKSKLYDYERKTRNKEFCEQIGDELSKILNQLKVDNKENSEEFIFFNNILINYHESIKSNPNDLLQFRETVYTPVLNYLFDSKKYLSAEYSHLIDLTKKANKSLTPIMLSNKKLGKDIVEQGESIQIIIQNIKPQTTKVLA